ncbi:uncharacterized protein KIAA2026-like isoform X2 [Hemiscyllium ocellatum]|uniref:uncharacterized protein KIAA2026-like isoform X2 n=1 Tax=Hemiscyllium ocellatum TaxID=170820 RepID=UPI0029667144|nr:uncharacterized protein KIAA2026-like isoform X2 [Hemiscyllium ocellatum]
MEATAAEGDGSPTEAALGRRDNEALDRAEDEASGRRRSKRPRPTGEEQSGAGGDGDGAGAGAAAAAAVVAPSPPRDEGPAFDDNDDRPPPSPPVPGSPLDEDRGSLGRAEAGGRPPSRRVEGTGPRTRSASGRLLPKANGVAGRPQDGSGAGAEPVAPELGNRQHRDRDGGGSEQQEEGEEEEEEEDDDDEPDDPTYEVQQGRRILNEFLLDKHRNLTAPFAQAGGGEPTDPLQPSPIWLHTMEEKFQRNQYGGITEFVADFRLMLESCYRLHGVDHWLSRQAQKLEMMLEQKLTLLSRPLREKTTIVVTSKGRYGIEEERGALCTSTRRRSIPRSLGGMSTGVTESIMIQTLRQEEQQRAREEKRLREQERKEAEEAVQKEIEEWEKSLRALAEPTRMETLWEIPAIGHFLCLAQQILNLPEVVYFDLERCLLMPQCSGFLAKIMTSLLSPHHHRATLHRKPPFPYKIWEAALKRRVLHWYVVVSQAENHNLHAEKLGLCPQFFCVLGETSPLEAKAFHQLTFYKRVWLLKGLCDYVYETQKEVQDAVLGQPIHECREVILGYDSHENAYVHFPQFCGADLRIYKQSPLPPPEFPIPPIKICRISQQRSEETKSELFSESHEKPKSKRKETTTKTITDSKKSNEGLDSSDLEDFYLRMESGSEFPSQEAKKPDSEKADEKKKKLISPQLPPVPQFQLICTSLDELRELIAKMEGELKELENNKKKSEKWFYRRQALKDLHGTLGRLLNELLPWEQKLIKAHQRNRARMKKDFDDFKKQPDNDVFLRDTVPSEEVDGEFMKDVCPNEAGSSNFADHQEIIKKECFEIDDMMQTDTAISVGKPKPIRRESSNKETQKQTSKNPKRQMKCSDLDECGKESSPNKKMKLSTNEAVVGHSPVKMLSGSEPRNQEIESKSATVQLPVESVTNLNKPDEHSVMLDISKGEISNVSRSAVQKRTKPIQALLAKHNGNKVTLTSQTSSSVREMSSLEEKVTAIAPHPSPTKSCLPTIPSPKGPLQMVYKMPDGSCVPIDLSSSQIKIAVQPVIDAKTGERIMQQVLIVPKNLLAQQQDGRYVEKGSLPKALKDLEKRASVGSQTADLGHSPTVDLQPLSSVQVQSQVSNLRPSKSTASLTSVITSVSQPTKVVSSCNVLASSVIAPQGRAEVTAPSVMTSNARGGQSTASEPVMPTKTQTKSGNTGTAQSFNPQQSKESNETKQELKTVCIRDSQSILVMTRGGNTGVVKVQSNSDQNSPNAITPRPIFTFLPEVQNFVVSKTQPLSPLTSILVPAQTSLTNISQLPVSNSISSVSLGLNQLGAEPIKLGSCKTVNNAGVVPVVPVPLPTVLSTVSENPTVHASSHNALNLVSGPIGRLASESAVQNKVTVTQAPSLQFSLDTVSGKQLFLTPPECNKSGGSTFLTGTTMPKFLLVPNPPATLCGTSQVSMAPTNAQPQKLVFMSPSVSSMSSSSNLVLTKPPQQPPATPLNTTQMPVKNSDPYQVVLVPYTGETPIKGNPLPSSFQMKEVKKGNLIRNSIQKVPGISILPTAKVGEGLSMKNAVSPTSCVSTSAIPSVVVGNQSSPPFRNSTGIKMCVQNAYTVATAATGTTLLTPTFTTFGSLPTTMLKGNDNISGSNQGVLATRLPVAISTVKAEHLASSMLLASPQPKISHQSLTSLPLPITAPLPNPNTVNSKMVPTNTQPISTAFSPQVAHFSKDSSQTVIRFPNPNTIASPTNTITVPRSAAVQAATRLNASTVGNVFAASLGLSLAHQTTVQNLTKHPVGPKTVMASTSLIQSVATVPSSISKVSEPLNESCVRQKIVINTSTPLAPGTQIVINNHRFVVPPQGLESGSHVLLISNTLKPSNSRAVSLSPGSHTGTDVTSASQKTTIVSALSHHCQSFPSPYVSPEKLLQTLCVPSAAQTITAVSRPVQLTTGSTPIHGPTARPSLQNAVCKFQVPTNQSALGLPVDTSFNKLLVSPEGAVLNAINTVVNPVIKVASKSSLTHGLGSSSASPAVVFPSVKGSEVLDPTRTVSASSSL